MKIHLVIPLLFLSTSFIFSQNYDAELLDQTTNIVVIKGKVTKNISYKIRINNRAGEQYTKVEIPYNGLNKPSDIKASITDINGNKIKKLKRDKIITRSSISSISLYEDDFVKEFTLKHNQYPYVLNYSYTVVYSEYLHIVNWIPVLDLEIPTQNACLRIETSVKEKINYTENLITSSSRETIEDKIIYVWKSEYLKPYLYEVYSPPYKEFLPYVHVAPEAFKFEQKGSFLDWESFGEWELSLLEGLNKLPENEIMKITSLISGLENQKDKVRTLYHYLQDNTRYVNVTIETGGLKPYPAEYVSKNKYGDCKALTNYFKSVLEHVGIESYYTSVFSGDKISTINLDFPSQQFNHIILAVPIEKDTIWLDCTSDGPFNYLGTFTQNRKAFAISKDGSKFIQTPALGLYDVLESRKIKFSQSFGTTEVLGDFLNKYRGAEFEKLLYLKREYNPSLQERVIKNHYLDKGSELVSYELMEPFRDFKSIELSYKTRIHNLYNFYGEDLLIDVLPMSIPNFEKPEKRRLPVAISYPINRIDSINYEIPNEYAVLNIPDNNSFESRFGQYHISFIAEGNNVLVNKQFIVYSQIISTNEYEEFYAFIKRVKEIDDSSTIITQKK
jgi:transglutaminase-like putative cysteine protease